MADQSLTAHVYSSVGEIGAAEWDALAGTDNPFVSHAFLTALENSGSVGPGTGWAPAPLVIESDHGGIAAALPAYAKGHSQGEYVFDHAWADAWHRAGGNYYPKLQITVPFTPATGPRLLLADERMAAPLLRAAEALCQQNGFSSAHATFIEPAQVPLFEAADWLGAADVFLLRTTGADDALVNALRDTAGAEVSRGSAPNTLVVRGLSGRAIAELTARAGVTLRELTPLGHGRPSSSEVG